MLRTKVLLQLLLIMLITLSIFGTSYYFLLRTYETMEAGSLEVNRQRAINALQGEIDRLSEINEDWSAAGLTYFLMSEPLLMNYLEGLIDAMTGSFAIQETALFDDAGELITARRSSAEGVDIKLDDNDELVMAAMTHPLLSAAGKANVSFQGLAEINGSLRLLSLQPVLAYPGAPATGARMLAASPLDEAAIAGLADIVRQQIDIVILDSLALDPDTAALHDRLLDAPDLTVSRPVGNNRVETFTLLQDFSGEYCMVLKITSNQAFLAQAKRAMLINGAGVVLLFILLISFFLLFLDKSVLRRLQAMSLATREVNEHSLDQRLPVAGNDEISAFSLAFNRLLDSLQNKQNNLLYQASHDKLTGLLNRHHFEIELKRSVAAAQEQEHENHLLFIDLDRFKIINDSCGHLAGDRVLSELAAIMQARLRTRDSLGRIGGDEFGVILNDCKTAYAFQVADKLREAIAGFSFQANGRNFTFGASIGLVSLNAADIISHTYALTLADSACRVAKNTGRNKIYQHQLHDATLSLLLEQTQWVNRINAALAEDRFALFQQLIRPLDPQLNPCQGVEILLRLQEEETCIAPGVFLPAAERYGLMGLIDKWVLEHFLQWYAQYGDSCEQIALFTINLSGQSLSDSTFPEYLHGLISNGPRLKHQLCFEITETSAIENLNNTGRLITTLKTLGCLFALDDFGAGMSSFVYLKNLPVDFLKIDGSFCVNMHTDPVDEAMVKSINDIGHVMGLKTIVEHIETRAGLEKAAALGVDFAQGYFLGRPEPLQKLPGQKPDQAAQKAAADLRDEQ
ncbi:MAG: EAL domain-containing protein [Pseudomonadales bacterium]|nr:EAL domain-containing protein [Pseudomonadales bacterium]